jgi:hypothetical protein
MASPFRGGGDASTAPRMSGTHPWRACLRGVDGAVLGAGVLVDSWHVLTCAHVVAGLLGTGSGATAPTGEVTVELPFLPASVRGGHAGPPTRIRAHVARQGWVPPTADGNGDLTLLRLERAAPSGLPPTRFKQSIEVGGGSVLVFGHPAGSEDGVWARTRVMAVGGPGGEWMQLDAAGASGWSVTHGFSGAGAVDEVTGEVLGVVVASDRDVESRVAWVIRMETAVTYLPVLTSLLPGTAEGGRRKAASVPERSRALPRLGDAERTEFFERLWAVPGMRERGFRDAYVRWLDQTHPGLPRTHHGVDRMDVWDLMHALSTDPQALRGFVTMLRAVHPGSGEVDLFEQYVERTFPDLLLEHSERVSLERLLDGVAPSWVQAALRSATAGFGIPPALDRMTSAEAIRELEGYGWTRGGPAPALLTFVDDLAHALGGPRYVALHRWIDDVADRLEILRPQIKALCDAADRRRAEQSSLSLVVQLDPDRSDESRYLMSALLMAQDMTERVLHRDDVARTLDEIALELDAVLTLVPEGLGDDLQDPVVEFILPRRLLAEPVDEWEIDRSAFSLPLGLRYPVVVRCLDRMRDPAHHVSWRRKSRRLNETGHLVDPEAVHHVTPEAPEAASPPGAGRARQVVRDHVKALFAELMNQEKVVCLAVPHPPDSSVPARPDAFVAGLAAGLPVILWAREASDPDGFFDVVRKVMAHGPLEIPRQVLHHRRELESGAERRGTSGVTVGVLFDDADRIPAGLRKRSIELRAPLCPAERETTGTHREGPR